MEKIVRKGNSTKVQSTSILIGIFLIPIIVLFIGIVLLLFHGFIGYYEPDFLKLFVGRIEKIFLVGSVFTFILLWFYFLGRLLPALSDRTLKISEAAALFLAVIVQLYFIFCIKSYYKWDSGYVIGAAASLVEQGTLLPESYHYISVYPNQNTFVCITAVLIKLANFLRISVENRPILFNLFNTVLMDISVFLILPISERISCRKTAEWEKCRFLLLLLLNPFWYLGTTYYYTITLSLPFMMGFLFFYLDILEKKGSWYHAVLAGFLLGIGYDIRPTAVIFATAAVITFVYKALTQKGFPNKKCGIQLGILLLTAVLTGGALASAEKKYIGIDTTDSAYPVVHWFMMSATYPGGHNIEDEAFTDSFATHEEKVQADKERLKQKLREMGLKGCLSLAAVKIDRTFGDGLNGYIHFLTDGYGTGTVFDWLFGSHKDLCVLYHQAYYLFLLAGILLGLFQVIKNGMRGVCDYGIYCMALTLFGAFLFYIIWEASSQYSIPFIGLMSVLAFVGLRTDNSKENETAVNKRQLQKLFPAFIIIFEIALLVYAGVRYSVFVKETEHFSRLSADQLMETKHLPVTNDEPLYQPLDLKQPFNQLVFQWRNDSEGQNNAQYKVCVLENNTPVFTEYIDAALSPSHGVGLYHFETITPRKGSKYMLSIEKTAGDEDKNLNFLVYDIYGYNPYPGGHLESSEKRGRTEALMFMISYEYDGVYISSFLYILFYAVILIILTAEMCGLVVLNKQQN